MQHTLCFRLASFGALSVDGAARVVSHLVEALAVANEEFLRKHPGIPALYRSGIRYVPDDRQATEIQWWDVPAILVAGYADCKALVAWRLAELRVLGYWAVAVITTEDGLLFHVTLLTPWGEEDPSCILGMCAP